MAADTAKSVAWLSSRGSADVCLRTESLRLTERHATCGRVAKSGALVTPSVNDLLHILDSSWRLTLRVPGGEAVRTSNQKDNADEAPD